MESKVFYAKSSEEAVEQLLKSTNADKDSIQITVLEKPSKGFLGIGAKSGVYSLEYELIKESEPSGQDKVDNDERQDKVNITEEDEMRIAKEFVVELLKNADVEAEVDVLIEDNLIKVKISGDDASCLIGRRGDTLDAIQFLTGLALNKFNKDSHTRVFVDIENYRSKREESLKRYCYKAAREVAKTRRTKKLDYMNPYERRIIHSALQNDRFVITYSEGTDPYRRVVIEYKR
ncbi:RNA-binding cell elongation regulator Jag/EloR [Peptostreptococcus stomatis]|uniref:RNA-binding cell elongation regulator Jag/EloR n=1 Tax=Peptostreptococcus stomatis TaxID=341694 RepID=UPI003FA01270